MKEKYKNLLSVIEAGVFLVAFGIIFFFLIFRAGSVVSAVTSMINILMPFIYGTVIAYLLRPICNQYEILLRRAWKKIGNGRQIKDGLYRMISIFLSFITAAVILYILLSSVIPQLTRSILRLSYVSSAYIQEIEDQLAVFLEDNPTLQNYLGMSVDSTLDTLQNWMETSLIPGIRNVVGNFADGIFNILDVMSDLLIGIVAAVYILANRHRLSMQWRMLLYGVCKENAAKTIENELRYADKMFTGFLGGKIVDSTIVGIICFIGCTIMGIPNTLLVSVIVGVTNIIPFFGPYIGLVPSAIIIFITSPIKCLWFIIFILILQQIDGNIIGPRILGDSTGLSGFWVLFSIIFFGGLMGFVGMIVGVPLFAVIYHIIQRAIRSSLKKRGREDIIEEYDKKYHQPDEDEKAYDRAKQKIAQKKAEREKSEKK